MRTKVRRGHDLTLSLFFSEIDISSPSTEPATKKRKTTATASKKGKGKARKPKKLELFQAIPLDVLVLVSLLAEPPRASNPL
jgi:hypothetical protein